MDDITGDEYITMNDIVDKMNELELRVDELETLNISLKNENDKLKRFHRNWDENWNIIKENQQLKECNDELKAQLYCNSDEGVCSICDNHYLVKGKTHEYYISKCKKEHEECSTDVLKYCNDFKIKKGE